MTSFITEFTLVMVQSLSIPRSTRRTKGLTRGTWVLSDYGGRSETLHGLFYPFTLIGARIKVFQALLTIQKDIFVTLICIKFRQNLKKKKTQILSKSWFYYDSVSSSSENSIKLAKA